MRSRRWSPRRAAGSSTTRAGSTARSCGGGSSPTQRRAARVESILHPGDPRELERQAARAPGPYQVLVIPLLVEAGLERLVDRVLVVDCPEEEQIRRLMARDGETREGALRMLEAQATRERRLAAADDVIDNGGSAAGPAGPGGRARPPISRPGPEPLRYCTTPSVPGVTPARFTPMEPLPQNRHMFEAAPEQRPDSEPIVYEQPLNERMRAFMRLEFLWQQLSYHAGLPNAWSSRSAVAGLLEILAITSRGDARGDVLKELERQMSALRDFQNRPGVDGARLRAVLSALMRRREELNAAGANFMQKLRESEFLNAIKHRSAIPGGTCEFDLPDFYHWL